MGDLGGLMKDFKRLHMLRAAMLLSVFALLLLFSLGASAENMSYKEYLNKNSKHEDISRSYSTKNIQIDIKSFKTEDMKNARLLDDNSLLNDDNGSVSFEFECEESGFYELKLDYIPLQGSAGYIQRSIYLNSALPFSEAEGVHFSRAFYDEFKPKAPGEKIKGNQNFPKQIEKDMLLSAKAADALGYNPNPLLFYIEKGKNTLTLSSLQEKMKIVGLSFEKPRKIPSYEEYMKDCENKGIKKIENASIVVQAENSLYKSDPSLHPICDRSSSATEPNHPSFIVMNAIGADAWNAPLEWISWEVEAEEEGLYRLSLRVKQNKLRGIYAIRKLYINDEVPFKEANELRFYHTGGFKSLVLSKNKASLDGDEKTEELYFALKKGKNTIKLEVALGELGSIIEELDELTKSMNSIYRRIIAITGTAPDTYRNYQLYKRIPGLDTAIKEIKEKCTAIEKSFIEKLGGSGEKAASLTRLISIMERLETGEEQLIKNLSGFKESITAIGKTIFDLKDQPITIDYFEFLGEKNKPKKANSNFFSALNFKIGAFIGSFINDYNSSEDDLNMKNSKKEINVWLGLGRDQFQIIRRLINESFTPKTGIKVNLKLISPDVLLPATMTGTGPDVAIQIGSNAPINFAFRGAAKNLRDFADFDEVKERFHKEALVGLTYEGGVYGLPDQMSFPVMFYRKDIFESRKLSVPKTWDELMALIPELKKENMDIYLDTLSPQTLGVTASLGSGIPINSIFLSRLFQTGGKIYSDDGSRCLFDDEKANAAFRWWTSFYTQHSFERDIDIVTRFRLGEVPLGIVDLNNYNNFMVSAPEIRNQWGIAEVPASRLPDGSLKHASPLIIGASMIIKNIAEKNGTMDEAWEFLKWWTSEQTQIDYARGMEAVLGPAGRYMVSNKAAFLKLGWPNDMRPVLERILENLKGIPEVPGGYITGRYLKNAFVAVLTSYANPSDTLFENARLINDEIKLKREEFNLDK